MTIKGYKLTGEIGHGGMSVVYAATRVASAEMHSLAPVAVKVFDAPEGPHRTELAKKFMQEAKILAALDHPNLIKVFDFGIARVLQPDTRRAIGVSTVTLEGNLGTPYVRAPECRSGKKATTAADVYSFGVLLYKLVTGIWYEGSSRLLEQARTFAPDWAPVLTRMLATNPAYRFADAAALPTDPAAKARKRRHVRRAVLVVTIALIACFATWCLTTMRRVSMNSAIQPQQGTPDVNLQGGKRKMTDEEWARYYFGTNEYDYVEEATLTRTNRLVLTRPVVYGTLHLPDTNGTVEVESPPGYEGYVVMARRIDGDLFYQMHVVRKGKLRVRASNRAIRVSYRPFPRNPEP